MALQVLLQGTQEHHSPCPGFNKIVWLHTCACIMPFDVTLFWCRTLSNNSFHGTLPAAWGWTPQLQLLQNLYLDQNPYLAATLPSAWGSRGGLSSLQVPPTRCFCIHYGAFSCLVGPLFGVLKTTVKSIVKTQYFACMSNATNAAAVMGPCVVLDSDSVQTAGQDLAACGMAEKFG